MNNDLIYKLHDLEILTNINIFKKNKIRNNNKIINECNKMKRKKILELSNELKIISHGSIIIDQIKLIHNNILYDIDNLNNIINIINQASNFIEIYSNDMS